MINISIEKIQKVKENREDASFVNITDWGTSPITRSLKGSYSSFRQAAAWSPWRDVTILITLRHDVITSWAKRQLPRASSRIWNEPRHEISNNVICATSKDSDQPAHTRSLIRAFASRLNFLWLLCYWLKIILSQIATSLEITFRCSNYKSSWYPIGTSVQGSWHL